MNSIQECKRHQVSLRRCKFPFSHFHLSTRKSDPSPIPVSRFSGSMKSRYFPFLSTAKNVIQNGAIVQALYPTGRLFTYSYACRADTQGLIANIFFTKFSVKTSGHKWITTTLIGYQDVRAEICDICNLWPTDKCPWSKRQPPML